MKTASLALLVVLAVTFLAACAGRPADRAEPRRLEREAPRAGAVELTRESRDAAGLVTAVERFALHQGEDASTPTVVEYLSPGPRGPSESPDPGSAVVESGSNGNSSRQAAASSPGPSPSFSAVRATFGAGHVPAPPPGPEAKSRGAVVWALGVAGAIALVGGFVVAGLWGIRAGAMISLGGAAAVAAAMVASQPWFPAVAAGAAALVAAGVAIIYGWHKRDSAAAAPSASA